jgi:hypothetical protein
VVDLVEDDDDCDDDYSWDEHPVAVQDLEYVLQFDS